MDFLGAGREGVEPAGDAVVEARADADHHVAIVHRHVGFQRAVHAEHAHPLRIGRRKGAKPHQRRGDRKAGELDQFAQQVAGGFAGIDHAAAGVEQRPLGMRHQFDRLLDLVDVALELGLVAGVRKILRLRIDALGELHVLRHIDHDRAGPAARSDVEGLVQHARQVLDALDQIIVLGAWPRDADGVRFLEGVVADQMGRHLSGDADDRDRVAQRVGQAGHRIGGAGAGGDQHAADLAGRAGIAFGRVHRALLVPHQDVLHLVLREQRVVDRQHRAARIAEQVLHALVGERLDHHFGAGHFACHGCHPSTSSLPALVHSFFALRMIFSENRFLLFGIMRRQ